MPEKSKHDNITVIHTSLGQYSIGHKLAQGGMAEIFKGVAKDLYGLEDRPVVIKRILPSIAANREFVDMLVSEAKIAVQLSHGNIAQIYDLGKVGNDYFMVMEFVDGKSLSQIHKHCVKSGELIPIEHTCYFISEVAAGLDYMHNKTDEAGNSLGIVHRDISPQNIIVSYSGTVKIIDFGIAKSALHTDSTEAGVLKGKFAYMSPEQTYGKQIDGRSDIFSLGVILFELLTGRRLFKDKDSKSTIKNVRRTDVEPPSKYNPDIPPELDAIVLKALGKKPEDRYQQAGLFRNELLKFIYTKFAKFNPADAAKFVVSMFGEELAERDEEKEFENTPVLIFDQTQTGIDIGPTAVMREFMLDNKDKKSDLDTNIAEAESLVETEALAVRLKGYFDKQIDKAKQIPKAVSGFWLRVRPYLYAAITLLAIASIAVIGNKLGWWAKWADFFTPVQITEEHGAIKDQPKEFAYLFVGSTPEGAEIFIDDISTNKRTPTEITDMLADGKTHKIGLYLDNHRYYEASFVARANEPARFTPTLEIAYASLEIISEPSKALVYINDILSGTTPFARNDFEPDAVLHIKLEKEGYATFEETIKVGEGKAYVLRPTLFTKTKRPGEIQVTIPKTSTEQTPVPEAAKAIEEPKPETMVEEPKLAEPVKAAPDVPGMMKTAPIETKE